MAAQDNLRPTPWHPINFDQLSGGALPAAAVQADFEHHIMTLSAAIDALAGGAGQLGKGSNEDDPPVDAHVDWRSISLGSRVVWWLRDRVACGC